MWFINLLLLLVCLCISYLPLVLILSTDDQRRDWVASLQPASFPSNAAAITLYALVAFLSALSLFVTILQAPFSYAAGVVIFIHALLMGLTCFWVYVLYIMQEPNIAFGVQGMNVGIVVVLILSHFMRGSDSWMAAAFLLPLFLWCTFLAYTGKYTADAYMDRTYPSISPSEGGPVTGNK
ncbi:hypothetical protein HXX76_014069 [Chlamydomonas incerta]|uniref:Uncharacterized protein n=1 Tax=Chlamydomonas incerta TaxID=51695 RepID=A0A835SS50_CHLIN|nr:hypothetical protein HXX76_014069 [Chlamydomonas incerta]|eukprot:KAG2424911.1 hypothetical protein HXX76_014069 [Chlamydomonas incerta]